MKVRPLCRRRRRRLIFDLACVSYITVIVLGSKRFYHRGCYGSSVIEYKIKHQFIIKGFIFFERIAETHGIIGLCFPAGSNSKIYTECNSLVFPFDWTNVILICIFREKENLDIFSACCSGNQTCF